MNKDKITVGNARHAYEYLQLINDAETEEDRIKLLQKWGANIPLSLLLSLNFRKDVVLDFPPGMPPYKRDESVHADMCTPLAGQIGRLSGCRVGSNMRRLDKERVLIQILEQIAHREADVLIAAKDKSLTEDFPNITAELVAKVYPNYVLL
jgi:hypothetical protein